MSHTDQKWGSVSYAQHGDDFVLLSIFDRIGIEKPSYLDLGAHHPFNISNTALLYERGSCGVNIEANPNLIAAFLKHRPRDVIVNVGVHTTSGEALFYMYDDMSGRNTFSVKEVDRFTDMNVKSVVKIKTLTLNDIVDQYCESEFPDLLNVDIEGLDFEVLRCTSFSIDNSPKVICVETRIVESDDMLKLLERRCYTFKIRMGENLFFIRDDFV